MNRIANRLYKMANNNNILDNIISELWSQVEKYIYPVADYLSTGRDSDFNLDDFLESDYSNRIALIDQYCKTDDRYKEIVDKAKTILTDMDIDKKVQNDILSDFNSEVYKEFMSSILDSCEQHGNSNN